MSRRVWLHIGLPKTGTSYLQAIAWPARERLREAGLVLPGDRKNDHLFASMVVRDDPGVRRRGPGAHLAWERIRRDIAGTGSDVLISHEFFCAATAEQNERLVSQLRGEQVEVVITAREPLGLFASSWQESLKNKATTPMADYSRAESEDPRDVWNWRALDLGLVLQRWSAAVDPEHVHVITPPPPGSPRELLWVRFAELLGIDPGVADASGGFANASMGVVEAETLRRFNEVSGPYDARARGRWLRSFLADQRLVPRGGERFWPMPDQVEDARARSERAVEMLRSGAYDVIGDVDSLLVPAELEPRRHPDSVTDAEVAACAVELMAVLMDDLRAREDRSDEHTRARGAGGRLARLARALRLRSS